MDQNMVNHGVKIIMVDVMDVVGIGGVGVFLFCLVAVAGVGGGNLVEAEVDPAEANAKDPCVNTVGETSWKREVRKLQLYPRTSQSSVF
jgi:hypothetical protein